MSLIIWDGTQDIEIPVNVAVCPECGAGIVADVFEVTSEDGETNWHLESDGSGLHIQCSKEDNNHYKMPYVDWLPIDDVVVTWLNKNVQFGNAAQQSFAPDASPVTVARVCEHGYKMSCPHGCL
jgi:hypothetical protein